MFKFKHANAWFYAVVLFYIIISILILTCNTCFYFLSFMMIILIPRMYLWRNVFILIHVNASIIIFEHRIENKFRNLQNNYLEIWQPLIIKWFNLIWFLRKITLHLVNIFQTPAKTRRSLFLNKWQTSRFHEYLLHQCSLNYFSFAKYLNR